MRSRRHGAAARRRAGPGTTPKGPISNPNPNPNPSPNPEQRPKGPSRGHPRAPDLAREPAPRARRHRHRTGGLTTTGAQPPRGEPALEPPRIPSEHGEQPTQRGEGGAPFRPECGHTRGEGGSPTLVRSSRGGGRGTADTSDAGGQKENAVARRAEGNERIPSRALTLTLTLIGAHPSPARSCSDAVRGPLLLSLTHAWRGTGRGGSALPRQTAPLAAAAPGRDPRSGRGQHDVPLGPRRSPPRRTGQDMPHSPLGT